MNVQFLQQFRAYLDSQQVLIQDMKNIIHSISVFRVKDLLDTVLIEHPFRSIYPNVQYNEFYIVLNKNQQFKDQFAAVSWLEFDMHRDLSNTEFWCVLSQFDIPDILSMYVHNSCLEQMNIFQVVGQLSQLLMNKLNEKQKDFPSIQ